MNVDPGVLPLASNVGPTQTHALAEDSPAIDNGSNTDCGSGLTVEKDQRGATRDDGACDIGAYEFIPPAVIEVTSALDDDGDGCTLREALVSINLSPQPLQDGCVNTGGTVASPYVYNGLPDQVVFDSSVAGNTIALTDGRETYNDLRILDPMSINADGMQTTIQAAPGNRVFRVAQTRAYLDQLTISGGDVDGNGGGIYVRLQGELFLSNSSVTGNTANTYGAYGSAGGKGGGLFAKDGSSVTLTNSTISGNTADSGGGGVNIDDSSLFLTDTTISGNTAYASAGGGIYSYGDSSVISLTSSTVSGNSAGQRGGGIYGYGDFEMDVVNSTISGNSTATDGGGFRVYGGSLDLVNTTVSDNTATGSGGAIDVNTGSTVTMTNTILANSASDYDCTDTSGTTISAFKTIIENKDCDVTSLRGDPGLQPLGDFGGSTLTHALLPSSPAIDAGDDTNCGSGLDVATDQRGKDRDDGNCDIGAFEFITLDFGDAPDGSYPTLIASDGARHESTGPFLGSSRDTEDEGLQSANADGDDSDSFDDEDGVSLDDPSAGFSTSLTVTVTDTGRLDAWIDYNADGDWDDPGEQIFTDQGVNAGANVFNITAPVDASEGTTFGRFRVSEEGGLEPSGFAESGEVEDYQINVIDEDTDNDGMTDDFEDTHTGLDKNDPDDATDDEDMDGLDNLGEFTADTDPNDPDSDGDGIGDAFDDEPNSPANNCNNGDATVVSSLNVPDGTVEQCAAETSIEIQSGVTIQSGGRLELFSPVVTFGSGFTVPDGAELEVDSTDPTPP